MAPLMNKPLVRSLLPAVEGLLTTDMGPFGPHRRFHLPYCDTPNMSPVTPRTKPRLLEVCHHCLCYAYPENVAGPLLEAAITLHEVLTLSRKLERRLRLRPGRRAWAADVVDSRTADNHIHRIIMDSYSSPDERGRGAFEAAQDAVAAARASIEQPEVLPLADHVELMIEQAQSARAALRSTWLHRARRRRREPTGSTLLIFQRDDLRPALFAATADGIRQRSGLMTLTVSDPIAIRWDSGYSGNDVYAYVIPEHLAMRGVMDHDTFQPPINVPADIDASTVQILLSLLGPRRLHGEGLAELLVVTAAAAAV